MTVDDDFNFIRDLSPQELLRLSELLDMYSEWYDELYTPFIGGTFDEELTALYRLVQELQDRQIVRFEDLRGN